MTLTTKHRIQLYIAAWLGSSAQSKDIYCSTMKELEENGLVKKIEDKYIATSKGLSMLSPMAQAACKRPVDYEKLNPREQWSIDERLGILDWDGN